MFGYVKPRHTDLLVKEYEFYRAAYCGVCRRMQKETGFFTSFALSYDIVFLAVCRMLTTDRRCTVKRCRCIAHPCRSRSCLFDNEALSYAARASAVLLYEKCEDDKKDRGSHRLRARLLLPLFRRAARRAKLNFLLEQTHRALAELSALEEERIPSIDAPAALFGDLLGLVFGEGLEGEAYDVFYKVGYELGVFIYAADAADDYHADKKSGSYNPYVLTYPPEAFAGGAPDEVKTALRLTLANLAEAVERLPFGTDTALENIIKNTVYLGLADRVELLGKPKQKKYKRVHPTPEEHK
ncbi:MAG: hypothetical protein IJV96_04515 [Clostridia bacterium]|nr:hypothetical protein [Clostridia bacterium]